MNCALSTEPARAVSNTHACAAALLLVLHSPVSLAGSDACTLAQSPGFCASPLFVGLSAAREAGYYPGENQRETISVENDFADGPTKSQVIIEQHGLLDDSVQAVRFVVDLVVTEDGTWRTASTERTWKCWPGRGSQTFSTTPCI